MNEGVSTRLRALKERQERERQERESSIAARLRARHAAEREVRANGKNPPLQPPADKVSYNLRRLKKKYDDEKARAAVRKKNNFRPISNDDTEGVSENLRKLAKRVSAEQMLRSMSPKNRPDNLREFGPDEQRHSDWRLRGGGQHVVLTAGPLSVTLQRTRHLANASFGTDDYQYHLKFSCESEGEPLEWDIAEKILKMALTTVLEWMVEEFNPEEQVEARLVELDIAETGLGANNGYYKSGTFDLTRIEISQLVDECLEKLQNAQNSDHTISLDDRLLVYVKVLTIPKYIDVRAPYQPKGFGKARPAATFAGSKARPITEGMKLLHQGTKQTGINFFPLPDWFPLLRDKCLPASLIIAHLHRQSLLCDYLGKENAPEEVRADAKKYAAVRKITVNDSRKAWQGAMKLNDLVILFLNEIGYELTGPYEIEPLCRIAAEKFNAQIRIYSSVGNRLEYCIPSSEEFSGPDEIFSRRQFALYKEEAVGVDGVAHIQALLKPGTFFKLCGLPCTYCDKHIYPAGPNSQHICRRGKIKRRTCFACDRLILPGNTDSPVYIDSSNERLFCINDPASSTNCKSCNVKCPSAQCLHNHRAKCNKHVKCGKCRANLRIQGGDPEATLERHECGEVSCNLCYTKYVKTDKPHLCLLKPPAYQRNHSYTAFYDVESITTKESSRSCESCALLRAEASTREGKGDVNSLKKMKCPLHIAEGEIEEGHHVPIFICLYFEKRGERGNYSKITFASSDLQHPDDCVLVENALHVNYIPDCMREANLDLDGNKKAKRRFGRAQDGIQSSKVAIPIALQNVEAVEGSPCNGLVYESLEQLRRLKNVTAMTKFISFLCRTDFSNYSVFALNQRGYDGQLLLHEMMLQGITPRIDSSGSKLLCVNIESHKIRFLDSLSYLPFGANELTKQYNLESGCKLSFPINMLHPQYYGYKSDRWPDAEFFFTFSDSEEALREKRLLVEKKREEKCFFSFKEQLALYCEQDVKILLLGMTCFLKQCYQVQYDLMMCLKPQIPEGYLPYLNPFSGNLFTFSSYCMTLYKIYCGHSAELYVFPERAISRISSSKGEMEYAAFLESLTGSRLVSKFTSEKPARFGPYTLDVFDPVTRTCWEFNGCNFHFCEEEHCSFRPKDGKERGVNSYGVSFAQMKRDEERRKECLLNEHNISKIIVMPECKWEEAKRADLSALDLHTDKYKHYAAIQHFMKNVYHERPPERISIRDALRGGRSEAFAMAFEPDLAPAKGEAPAGGRLPSACGGEKGMKDYTCTYIDKNALYSSVASIESPLYPTGPPINLINQRDLNSIEIRDGRFTFLNEDNERTIFEGFLQVTISAPRQLLYPFLPYRFNSRSLVALCRTCAERRLTRACTHTDKEREWTSTYCTDELVHAVELGYTIEKIWEGVIYTEFTALFTSFLSLFQSYRMRNSGFPTGAVTESQKWEYCNSMNDAMGFNNEYTRITPDMVCLNLPNRVYFKLIVNSLLGDYYTFYLCIFAC
jgi:hypothetical protein